LKLCVEHRFDRHLYCNVKNLFLLVPIQHLAPNVCRRKRIPHELVVAFVASVVVRAVSFSD
jgi:hypothetical protein